MLILINGEEVKKEFDWVWDIVFVDIFEIVFKFNVCEIVLINWLFFRELVILLIRVFKDIVLEREFLNNYVWFMFGNIDEVFMIMGVIYDGLSFVIVLLFKMFLIILVVVVLFKFEKNWNEFNFDWYVWLWWVEIIVIVFDIILVKGFWVNVMEFGLCWNNLGVCEIGVIICDLELNKEKGVLFIIVVLFIEE